MNWFVELPEDSKIVIGGLVMTVLDLAFAWVLAYIPWLGGFLQKYKEEWAAGLTILAVDWVQSLLPSAYPDLSILGVQFVLALVLTLIIKKTLLSKVTALQ